MTTPRSRVMAVLTVVAMLAVGVCIGVALDRNLLHRRGDVRDRSRGRGGPLGMMSEPVDTAGRSRVRERIVKRIADDLTLTSAQAHAMDSIFARHELQLDSMRAHVGPQLDTLRDRMRLAIDSMLTPEQRIKFAESRKKFDARRRPHGGDGPPPARE